MLQETSTYHKQNKGSIEVICGSMFSGKTEELIRRLKRAQFARQKVAIFKPCIDTRYDKNNVISHDLNEINSQAISSSNILLEINIDAEVVGIDEAQFFDLELPTVCSNLASRGMRIIIAGLDMDYLGAPFGPMPELMSIAEFVTKVNAICMECGDLALHSHRTVASKNLVHIGEQTEYQALCRSCFKKKNPSP
tara:strand:+ start:1961 stop:2542 length:582 start_codon:yes stop_codon:yes gene_type:complete